MKKEDIYLLLLAILLMLAMLFTLLRGEERSRHGYGRLLQENTLQHFASNHPKIYALGCAPPPCFSRRIVA